jgi:hypothetical protein
MARNRTSVSISVAEEQRDAFYDAVKNLLLRLGARDRSTLAVNLVVAQAAGTIDHLIEEVVRADEPQREDERDLDFEERPIFVISITPSRKQEFEAALDQLKQQSHGSTSSIVVRMIIDVWQKAQAALVARKGSTTMHEPSLLTPAAAYKERSADDILRDARERIPAIFECQGTSALDLQILGPHFHELDRPRRMDWLSTPEAEPPTLEFLLIHGWQRFISGRTKELRQEVPTLVQRLDRALSQSDQPLDRLTQGYQFAAVIARDTGDYDAAFQLINKAIDSAYQLYQKQPGAANHIASALYRRSSIFRQQMWCQYHSEERQSLAVQAANDMEEAVRLAPLCRLPVRLVIESGLAVTRAQASMSFLPSERLYPLFERLYREMEHLPDTIIADETGLIFCQAGIWHRHAQIALAFDGRDVRWFISEEREVMERENKYRDFVSLKKSLEVIDKAIDTSLSEYRRWRYDMLVTQIGLYIHNRHESLALDAAEGVRTWFQGVESRRITLKLHRLLGSIPPIDKPRDAMLDQLARELSEK